MVALATVKKKKNKKMLQSTIQNVAGKRSEGRINAFYSKQMWCCTHTLDEEFLTGSFFWKIV